MVWVTVSIALVLAGAIVLVGMRRSRAFQTLGRSGVVIDGVVVRKYSTANAREANTKRIGFRYVGPDGRRYDRFASIADLHWRELERGDVIPLVMLPDNPAISAPAWLVDPARSSPAGQEA